MPRSSKDFKGSARSDASYYISTLVYISRQWGRAPNSVYTMVANESPNCFLFFLLYYFNCSEFPQHWTLYLAMKQQPATRTPRIPGPHRTDASSASRRQNPNSHRAVIVFTKPQTARNSRENARLSVPNRTVDLIVALTRSSLWRQQPC